MSASERHPWDDWIPGVLSREQVEKLCDGDYLRDADKSNTDHSSIDIRLSDEVYELVSGSVKPFGRAYLHKIKKQGLIESKAAENGIFTLDPKKTYLFRAMEKLDPSAVGKSSLHGQATAKSSVGRVDVLARLIVDGMDSYEGFTPDGVSRGNGDIFVEVTPITFAVQVKAETSLSQLRFFCGNPSNAEVRGEEVYQTLLKDVESHDGMLSLDLSPVEIAGELASAFRASQADKSECRAPIPLWKVEQKPNPTEYWERAEAKLIQDESGRRLLSIEPGRFYILRSREKIAVPKGIAVYCRAIDETIGEIRIHYAGFVHPFFGRERSDNATGTPLIFEVRGHDIKVSLRDGEKLARLIFYRMSEDAKQDRSDAGQQGPSNYSEQTLQLSKFFDDWKS